MNEKEERIQLANEAIYKIDSYVRTFRDEGLRKNGEKLVKAIRDLRDTQYLFDSGEKELKRFYKRYLPYFVDILKQYSLIKDSANYEAIRSNRTQLETMMKRMERMVRDIIQTLPQDEIDEANAQAKAEEVRRRLESQQHNMVK